ncbi:hypothetical protein [Streptomyces sp. ITFR-16]|uniref:hypothetical protein n=1 Tax=Streptomyces sp. ITFR-16 TaxID=3075198 RepID=UPI00288A63A8|nr:hypothetical protein [Streptomyces sp. ITFR-16]WNI26366.1 hypothetical protein RLT58_32795 [Streptomyces sp. ITFR-16]
MPRNESVTESAPQDQGMSAQAAIRALASVETARKGPGRVAYPWWYGPLAALAVAAAVVVVGVRLTGADHPGRVWAGAAVVWGIALLLMRTRSRATGVRLRFSAHFRRVGAAHLLVHLAATGAAWALCALLGAGGTLTTAVVALVAGLGAWARVAARNSRIRRGLGGHA